MKKLIHIAVVPGVDRRLRILAATYGVHQGEALAGLLDLAASRPALEVAQVMAAQDRSGGRAGAGGAVRGRSRCKGTR